MAIGEVCSREVVICSRETSIEAAAELMRRHHVGAVVVVDDRGDGSRVPVGMLTDRDITVGVVAKGLPPDQITVGEAMVPELVTGRDSDGVAEALGRMRAHGVRRMPVVDAGGRLLGIIAADDLLDLLAEEMTALAGLIARQQHHEAALRR
jgi:CBS domain-containing protein